MKKAICVMLSLLLLLGAAACSAPAQNQDTEAAASTQAGQTGITSAETEGATTAAEEAPRYTAWNEVPTNEYRQEEITVDLNGQTVWGVVLIPALEQERYPLVICCHELGLQYDACMDNAELMATHGVAACCFEFRGVGSNSEISPYEMSIMTEVEDTQAVIAAAGEWSFVDPEKIVLYGRSMGGAVAAIAAARSAERVNGLILCYAALSMADRVRDQFSSLEEVPSTFPLSGTSVTLGKAFAEDVWDYDILAEIGSYAKPVLLLHGKADIITRIGYMEQAAEIYPDAVLYTLNGGHGFSEKLWEEANGQILQYLQDINVIAAN